VKGIAATTIAGAFALTAFAVAVLAGLGSGNPAPSVLVRALIAMLVCYPIGLVLGTIAQRLVQDEIERHRDSNPETTGGDEEPDDGEIEIVHNEDGEEVFVV
jgi:hypothetical protein